MHRDAYSPVARLSICSRSSTWLSLQRNTRPAGSFNGTQDTCSPTYFPSAASDQPHAHPHPHSHPAAVCRLRVPIFLAPSKPGPQSLLTPPLLGPAPYKNREREAPPNRPSRAPDGVDVRVELLYSGSQKLEEPLGEDIAACGPRHRRPCPGHSGRTSPRHHELPLSRNLPRGPPGTEAPPKCAARGRPSHAAPAQPPGLLGNGVSGAGLAGSCSSL